MLKLFFSPLTSSLATHIALLECGADFELDPRLMAKQATRTPEYLAKNPNGKTPLVEFDDGQFLAESGAILPASVGVVSGYDPLHDERYVNQLFLAMTGGAGAPKADAWVTLGHVGNAGLCYQDSIELDEMRHPLHVHQRRFIQDSEGAGQQKGGPGMLVEFGPTRGEMEVAFVSDGTSNPARGVRGGGKGGAAYQAIRDADGTVTPTENCAVVTLRTGESIVSHCCGGGGYAAEYDRHFHG